MSISESEIRSLLADYEAASNRYVFDDVAGMIHPDATYRFTDGDFIGIEAIRGAFEQTWANSANVVDERYWLTDVKVIHTDENSASITYDFNWTGVAPRGPFTTTGRGTAVIVRNGDKLQFIYEHLSH
jgi:ketosteroid isomerase-like protein